MLQERTTMVSKSSLDRASGSNSSIARDWQNAVTLAKLQVQLAAFRNAIFAVPSSISFVTKCLPDGSAYSTEQNTLTLTVTAPLPNCPSAEAAYEALASPSRMHEWREQFALLNIQTSSSEPLHTNDSYVISVPMCCSKYASLTMYMIEGKVFPAEEKMVIDFVGKGFCGMLNSRLTITVFKRDGIWMGQAQEIVFRNRWLFTPSDVEHLVMFKGMFLWSRVDATRDVFHWLMLYVFIAQQNSTTSLLHGNRPTRKTASDHLCSRIILLI